MPWKDLSPVTERERFIHEYMKREESVAELARRFEISRKTAYKWIDRYLSGMELVDRSRRPHESPKKTAAWLEEAIVASRRLKPRWGPKKLRAILLRDNPGIELPALSTFALIFKRHGLVFPRRRRARTPPATKPYAKASAPNAVWCVDFKGDFAVGKGRCYPLTIMDAYSRYLLACVALRSTALKGTRRGFEAAFREFGLPEVIRSDNGAPFAGTGFAGLSQLSVWWAKLGIRHERIEPGKPQQNGRHERMHGTLKVEATIPPAATLRGQQRAFDRFRHEYNDERPHEALGQEMPKEHYEPSKRTLPEPPWGRDYAYPAGWETVRISKLGRLSWNGRGVFLSTALTHELLGLDWEEDGAWSVYFRKRKLGRLTHLHLRGRKGKMRFAPWVEPQSPKKRRSSH